MMENLAGPPQPITAEAVQYSDGSVPHIECARYLAVRTIRAALWGGHEGRRAGAGYYLRNHYGGPEPETTTKEYENLSIYFNVNWYGRFRGIFMK